ncbi:hypothetical protein AACG74_13980 [Escherichia coli]
MNIRRKDKHTNYAPDFQGAQSRELLSLNQGDLLLVMPDAILKHPAGEI